MPTPDCPFCEPPATDVLDQEGPVYATRLRENHLTSVMVIPYAHRATPWELTPDEWSATQRLLSRLQAASEADGFTVGWNVGPVGGQTVDHVHCHLVPRHADEPYAGRGLRTRVPPYGDSTAGEWRLNCRGVATRPPGGGNSTAAGQETVVSSWVARVRTT